MFSPPNRALGRLSVHEFFPGKYSNTGNPVLQNQGHKKCYRPHNERSTAPWARKGTNHEKAAPREQGSSPATARTHAA